MMYIKKFQKLNNKQLKKNNLRVKKILKKKNEKNIIFYYNFIYNNNK